MCLAAAFLCLSPLHELHAAEPRTVMVYGDSNVWGWNPMESSPAGLNRYPADIRWSGRLSGLLAPQAVVVEEGLNGRTTNLGMAGNDLVNGLAYLPVALCTHSPLDVVVISLGINDFQAAFQRSPEESADAVRQLVRVIRDEAWRTFPAGTGPFPKILILAPSAFNDEQGGPMASLYAGAHPKTLALPALLEQTAAELDVEFLDLASVVPYAEGPDGLHYTPDNHRVIARAVADKIRQMFDKK